MLKPKVYCIKTTEVRRTPMLAEKIFKVGNRHARMTCFFLTLQKIKNQSVKLCSHDACPGLRLASLNTEIKQTVSQAHHVDIRVEGVVVSAPRQINLPSLRRFVSIKSQTDKEIYILRYLSLFTFSFLIASPYTHNGRHSDHSHIINFGSLCPPSATSFLPKYP